LPARVFAVAVEGLIENRNTGPIYHAKLALYRKHSEQGNDVTVSLPQDICQILWNAIVKTVNLQGILHDKFYEQNFANIPTTLCSPLIENACNFTIWMTSVAGSAPMIPGRYI